MSRRDELVALMADMRKRRLDAFKTTLEAQAEAITHEDIDLIHEAMRMLDDFSQLTLDLWSDLTHEWAKGWRCCVCGMTPAQANAANYNCGEEC